MQFGYYFQGKAVFTIERIALTLSSFTYLSTSRGPLSTMSSLDVMWVSFYSIALLLGAVLIISAVRKWVRIPVISFLLKFVAYGMFMIGSFLMVLVIATWPN